MAAVSIGRISYARVGWLGTASAHSEGNQGPQVTVKTYLSWAAPPYAYVCGCVTDAADRVLAYADKRKRLTILHPHP